MGLMLTKLWRLFNASTETPKQRSVIVDGDRLWPIDDSYRQKGEDEGWLVYVGYHRDEENIVVYRYRMRM